MRGAKKINSKVFATLLFSRFGAPQRVEVLARYKHGLMENVTLAFAHKETCENNSCLRDGLWVDGKKVSLPADLLGGVIDGLKGIQPSPIFDGKYRIDQIVAELFFLNNDKPKRLEILAAYGQRCVTDVYFVFSSKNYCQERSCNVGKWACDLEVCIAADALPELVASFIKMEQEATGG